MHALMVLDTTLYWLALFDVLSLLNCLATLMDGPPLSPSWCLVLPLRFHGSITLSSSKFLVYTMWFAW